jgi:hypothetical protein
VFFLSNLNKNRPLNNAQVALVILPGAAKINFNFDPAKKEIYSVNLNALDLTRFRAIAFSAKKTSTGDRISLRIEFSNKYKEKAHIYINDIPLHWQGHEIYFSDFKGISDWSEMSRVSFIVEEWNTRSKRGVLYIEDVRFLR